MSKAHKKAQKLESPQLNDNLAGFPQATITQLEEALEERVENRRNDDADTYPLNRDRRMLDRRQEPLDLWLCAGEQEQDSSSKAASS